MANVWSSGIDFQPSLSGGAYRIFPKPRARVQRRISQAQRSCRPTLGSGDGDSVPGLVFSLDRPSCASRGRAGLTRPRTDLEAQAASVPAASPSSTPASQSVARIRGSRSTPHGDMPLPSSPTRRLRTTSVRWRCFAGLACKVVAKRQLSVLRQGVSSKTCLERRV